MKNFLNFAVFVVFVLADKISFGFRLPVCTIRRQPVMMGNFFEAAGPVHKSNIIRYDETPETIFYRALQPGYQSSLKPSPDGLIYPLVNPTSSDYNGEFLSKGSLLRVLLCPDSRAYILPEKTVIPEGLSLIQDNEDLFGGRDANFYLVPSAPCTVAEFEKNFVQFVMHPTVLCVQLHEHSLRNWDV